MITDSTKHNS